MTKLWRTALAAATVFVLSGQAEAASIKVMAFARGGIIPKKHSCDGKDISPKVVIRGVPENAKSLALIMDDPDAPMGTWNHWILYDLPPKTKELAEGYKPSGAVKSGTTDFGRTGYGGPCPPRGSEHRYYFRLYALDKESLGLAPGATRAQVDAAIKASALKGFPVVYMGRYGR